jgi:hypothetical protein
VPSCLRASAETGDDVDGFCRDLPRSQMSAICPFPSPWPSAPNVRFFANAAQVRRLGLIAAKRESKLGPSEGGRGCEGRGRTRVVRVLPKGAW